MGVELLGAPPKILRNTELFDSLACASSSGVTLAVGAHCDRKQPKKVSALHLSSEYMPPMRYYKKWARHKQSVNAAQRMQRCLCIQKGRELQGGEDVFTPTRYPVAKNLVHFMSKDALMLPDGNHVRINGAASWVWSRGVTQCETAKPVPRLGWSCYFNAGWCMEGPNNAGEATEEDEERAEEERNKQFESCVPIFGFLHQVSVRGRRTLRCCA